jgi:hypothetical protein
MNDTINTPSKDTMVPQMDDNGVKKTIIFFICIVLYILSFVFLYQRGITEYIAYVFVFIVNFIFPFVWLKDYRQFMHFNFGNIRDVMSNGSSSISQIFMHIRSNAIYVVLGLQMITMLFVLLKNENVRKMKDMNKDEYASREEKNNLDTKNHQTEYKDNVILNIFVTITVTTWALIANTFSLPTLSETMKHSGGNISIFDEYIHISDAFLKSSSNTSFIQNLRWLLNQPFFMIESLDNRWAQFTDQFRMMPSIKILLFYAISFVTLFFGIFFRTIENPNQSDYRIVNLKSPFTPMFERNISHYRNWSLFLLTSVFSIILTFILNGIQKMTSISKTTMQVLGSVLIFSLFAIIFGNSMKILPDSAAVKTAIFALLAIVFSLIGTPITLVILQIFAEINLLKYPIEWISGLFARMSGKPVSFSYMNTLNSGPLLSGLFALFSLFWFSFIFGYGLHNNWLSSNNTKPFLLFNAILICMGVSLYVGFSSCFPTGTILYTVLKNVIDFILLFGAPIIIVILSIVQFVYAFKNYQKYKQYEKLKKKE